MRCYAISLSLSPHIRARPFREGGLGKLHSIAGVRSLNSPAQGSQASTANALLLKAGRPPRPKLSCSRQSGLHDQSYLAQGRPSRCQISPALCSPTDCQLCRPNSLNSQPNYLVCNLRGYTCALGAHPFLLFLIGEDGLNVQIPELIVVNCTTQCPPPPHTDCNVLEMDFSAFD